MKKIVLGLWCLLAGFVVTAQDTVGSSPDGGLVAQESTGRVPDTFFPNGTPEIEPFVPESGNFFDLTLVGFLQRIRHYGFIVPVVPLLVNQKDGTHTSRLIYTPFIRFDWLLGSQSRKLRSITMTGTRFENRGVVTRWIEVCNSILGTMFPKLNDLERVRLLNEVLTNGTATQDNAIITFTDDTANSAFVFNITVAGSDSTQNQGL